MGVSGQNQRAPVRRNFCGDDVQVASRRGLLVIHRFIWRLQYFQAIGWAHIFAELDFHFSQMLGDTGIDWPIKGNAHFHRSDGPHRHNLRSVNIGIGDFEYSALTLWPRSPVRQPAVAAGVKGALRRNGDIGREHVQTRQDRFLADIAGRSFHQTNAPDFSPRLSGYESIAFPPFRAERLLVFCCFIEYQSAA